MAGGSRSRTEQHGKLIEATLSLSSNCYYHSCCECNNTIESRSIEQEKKEFQLLYQRHINLLQHDINRYIFMIILIQYVEYNNVILLIPFDLSFSLEYSVNLYTVT
jgi:hypothetical protein